ncbi:hypothetical protein [Mucilaginibacter jinjuensis]|uniref:LTXXQ motif family protein n=1 Tax=Mucilaginibacter jinjuensis TaxID=1176721 RepID=A0ABY7TC89_9SPHI|nr:hypothetical protein [Mucilaginibacter jinjuensis]WCT13690.1 hypothetical protein PQO05_07040 [Mucilaginibacter jinjuensis]
MNTKVFLIMIFTILSFNSTNAVCQVSFPDTIRVIKLQKALSISRRKAMLLSVEMEKSQQQIKSLIKDQAMDPHDRQNRIKGIVKEREAFADSLLDRRERIRLDSVINQSISDKRAKDRIAIQKKNNIVLTSKQ